MAEITSNRSTAGAVSRKRRREFRSYEESAPFAWNSDAVVVRGPDDELALDRARAIRVGEWLVTTDGEGRPMIPSVAFVAEDRARYELAHRNGVTAKTMELWEVADALRAGRIMLLDDGGSVAGRRCERANPLEPGPAACLFGESR